MSLRAELLAPAGSFLSAKAAVNAGADAVYMGGRRFGARAYAVSASSGEEDMLMEAIEYCHLFSVKVYMTLNILFKDFELKELFSYLKPYYEAGLDGVIVQDLGAASVIRRDFPDLKLHASTQLAITGPEGVLLAKGLGFSRAVLARELSLEEIRRIHERTGLELEVFVHGAMCYSYSGACFMSSLLGGRSGNRGRCAGPCRLCYETGGKKAFYLSMKDMETLDLLPELLSAGAYSLKIEGRMKPPLYTAGVVSVYRKYLDLALSGRDFSIEEGDREILREMYDRGGVSNYLKRRNGPEMLSLSERSFRAERAEISEPIRENYLKRERTLPLSADFYVSPGERASLSLTLLSGESEEIGEIRIVKETEEIAEAAEGRALLPREVEEKLRSCGGSGFRLEKLSLRMEGALFLPISSIKRLRREAFSELRRAILEKRRRRTGEAGQGEARGQEPESRSG